MKGQQRIRHPAPAHASSPKLKRYLCEGRQEPVNVPIMSDVLGIQIEIPRHPAVHTGHFPVEIDSFFPCEARNLNLKRSGQEVVTIVDSPGDNAYPKLSFFFSGRSHYYQP